MDGRSYDKPRLRPMTRDEQDEFRQVTNVIRSCVSSLHLTRCLDDDVQVALARLENWIAENEGRWVA